MHNGSAFHYREEPEKSKTTHIVDFPADMGYTTGQLNEPVNT